jgi:hypothetical protein
MIAGAMKTHLDPENEPDLCVLAPPVEQDRLTVLLEGPFSYFFRVSISRVILHDQRTERDTFRQRMRTACRITFLTIVFLSQ